MARAALVLAVALFSALASTSAAGPSPALRTRAIEYAAQHGVHLPGFTVQDFAAASRRLLAAENKCLWDAAGTSCDLNPAFTSTLPTPTTDSAKALAAYAYRSSVCQTYTSASACNAKESEGCVWSSSSCDVGAIFSKDLVRGLAYCPGSLMDDAVTCVQVSKKADCNANQKCKWASLNFTDSAVSLTSNETLGTLAGFGYTLQALVYSAFTFDMEPETDDSALEGSAFCTGQWATDFTRLLKLEEQTHGKSLPAAIYGSCTGVDGVRASTLVCGTYKNETICDKQAVCTWYEDVAHNETTCMGSPFAFFNKIIDESDPWVKNISTAGEFCDAQSTQTLCQAAGTFERNAQLFNSFASLKPSYMSGGAGAVLRAPLLLSALLAGAAAWLSFLMHQ